MNAIKTARKLIAEDPTSSAAMTLSRLVLALESEATFDVGDLYDLDINAFDLALKILEEWRIDRYYAGKAKLFDLSYQVNKMQMS
jgi:hypothetical protein